MSDTYDPSQPLPANATEKQLRDRLWWFHDHDDKGSQWEGRWLLVAREYADARVAEVEARWRSKFTKRKTRNDDYATETEARLAAVTAERDSLRQRIAELAQVLEAITLISEESVIRPAAMSHQKPSEFKANAVHSLRALAAEEARRG